jgi:6-pyruvoyltetrahydropterin/6-carboxytetrahydropterin synthase
MPAVEFTRRFSMAHRLIADPADKCATPHGHNEFVRVRLLPTAPLPLGGANALAPFARLKARWHQFIDTAVDHAFQVNEADPLIGFFQAHEPARLGRLMVFPGDPTTEALVVALWFKLEGFLATEHLPFTLGTLAVEETPTNTVSLTAAEVDPAWRTALAGRWPLRADMSINEFAAPLTQ